MSGASEARGRPLTSGAAASFVRIHYEGMNAHGELLSTACLNAQEGYHHDPRTVKRTTGGRSRR